MRLTAVLKSMTLKSIERVVLKKIINPLMMQFPSGFCSLNVQPRANAISLPGVQTSFFFIIKTGSSYQLDDAIGSKMIRLPYLQLILRSLS
jgi:hypothetical protein